MSCLVLLTVNIIKNLGNIGEWSFLRALPSHNYYCWGLPLMFSIFLCSYNLGEWMIWCPDYSHWVSHRFVPPRTWGALFAMPTLYSPEETHRKYISCFSHFGSLQFCTFLSNFVMSVFTHKFPLPPFLFPYYKWNSWIKEHGFCVALKVSWISVFLRVILFSTQQI